MSQYCSLYVTVFDPHISFIPKSRANVIQYLLRLNQSSMWDAIYHSSDLLDSDLPATHSRAISRAGRFQSDYPAQLIQ